MQYDILGGDVLIEEGCVKVEQNLILSLEDPPEEEVEEQGVEVDTDADRSRKQGHLAPQMGVVRVPDKKG